MKHWQSCLTMASLAVMFGCAHSPRPATLDQSRLTAEGDGAKFARRLAPQAFARAEGLRLQAEEAQTDGRSKLAAALAERSLVAFERAALEARKIEALRRVASAEQTSQQRRGEIARLVGLQAEIASETKGLELRIEIEANTLTRLPLEAEDAGRTAARVETARSILQAARVLCAAAHLLSPDDDETEAAVQAADSLSTTFPTLAAHEALTRALDQRIQCLTALSKLKRRAARTSSDTGDGVLASLSPSFGDLRPHRDDRGVVLTARNAWDGRQLTASGREVLDRITRLAGARSLPLLVVLHSVGKPGNASAELRPAIEELRKGLPHASFVEPDTRLPSLLALPQPRNEAGRIEFIFVTP